MDESTYIIIDETTPIGEILQALNDRKLLYVNNDSTYIKVRIEPAETLGKGNVYLDVVEVAEDGSKRRTDTGYSVLSR